VVLSKVEAQQLRAAIAINIKRRVAAGLKLKETTRRASLVHLQTPTIRPI
jgi:hypothetical protein